MALRSIVTNYSRVSLLFAAVVERSCCLENCGNHLIQELDWALVFK